MILEEEKLLLSYLPNTDMREKLRILKELGENAPDEEMRMMILDLMGKLGRMSMDELRALDKEMAEYGTHDELLSAGGAYSEMFNVQAAYYVEGGEEDENARAEEGR